MLAPQLTSQGHILANHHPQVSAKAKIAEANVRGDWCEGAGHGIVADRDLVHSSVLDAWCVWLGALLRRRGGEVWAEC